MISRSLMFHHFHNDAHFKCQGSLSADDFERVILQIGPKNILSANDWYERANTGQLSLTDWTFTFDDALLSQYDIAVPIMEKYGLTGIWFVYSAPLIDEYPIMEAHRKFRSICFANIDEFYLAFEKQIENSAYKDKVFDGLKSFPGDAYIAEHVFYTYVDRKFRFIRDQILGGVEKYNEILELMINAAGLSIETLCENLWLKKQHVRTLHDKNHLIGLHSHTHPVVFQNLDPEAQRAEYSLNKNILEGIIHSPVKVMSHPSNSYSRDTLDLLKSLGIPYGFRSDWFHDFKSNLELPRADHSWLTQFNKMDF